jgi:hypothetical protein
MQIPLISGIGTTETAEFEEVYPTSLEQIGGQNGIAKGQVRLAPGSVTVSTGPGVCRGAILWSATHLRVMGTKLVSVDKNGITTTLGDVGGTGPVSWARGFDRIGIRSGTSLYYWNGTTLTEVTDTDLGKCLDVAWLNGQFFSTDGTYILAADIDDPTSWTATRYGSAESSPDAVTGLIVSRNEMFVLGDNTIEVDSYTGGSNFPLTVNTGATIPKGCVGPMAKCLYSQSFAFVGGGFNEQPGVFLQDGASAQKISTRAIDKMLASVADPSLIEMESRVSDDEERLFIHLPDKTLVFLMNASTAAQDKVWYIAKSGRGMENAYRLRHPVLAYGKWWVGDTETASLGTLSDQTGDHFGDSTGWQFQTTLTWNKAKGFIVHDFELVGLYGRGVASPAVVYWSSSKDGQTWSMERANRMPVSGDRKGRLTWNPHARYRNYATWRFRGDSNSLIGIAALNVPDDSIESLNA